MKEASEPRLAFGRQLEEEAEERKGGQTTLVEGNRNPHVRACLLRSFVAICRKIVPGGSGENEPGERRRDRARARASSFSVILQRKNERGLR